MCYLIVVYSHTKGPGVLQCNHLHDRIFTRAICAFWRVRFCVERQWHSIHIKWIQRFLQDVSSGPHYNALLSHQVEWSGQDVHGHPKKGFKKALGTPTDRALQQILQLHRITLNPDTPIERLPVETMFARKVKSVYDSLIPQQAKFKTTISPHKEYFYPGDKIFFKACKNNITFWEVGIIKQRIGELVYIVQGPKNTHTRHMNQLREYRLNESEKSPQNTCEEPIDVIFTSISTRTKSLRKHDARKEKENLRNHST